MWGERIRAEADSRGFFLWKGWSAHVRDWGQGHVRDQQAAAEQANLAQQSNFVRSSVLHARKELTGDQGTEAVRLRLAAQALVLPSRRDVDEGFTQHGAEDSDGERCGACGSGGGRREVAGMTVRLPPYARGTREGTCGSAQYHRLQEIGPAQSAKRERTRGARSAHRVGPRVADPTRAAPTPHDDLGISNHFSRFIDSIQSLHPRLVFRSDLTRRDNGAESSTALHPRAVR